MLIRYIAELVRRVWNLKDPWIPVMGNAVDEQHVELCAYSSVVSSFNACGGAPEYTIGNSIAPEGGSFCLLSSWTEGIPGDAVPTCWRHHYQNWRHARPWMTNIFWSVSVQSCGCSQGIHHSLPTCRNPPMTKHLNGLFLVVQLLSPDTEQWFSLPPHNSHLQLKKLFEWTPSLSQGCRWDMERFYRWNLIERYDNDIDIDMFYHILSSSYPHKFSLVILSFIGTHFLPGMPLLNQPTWPPWEGGTMGVLQKNQSISYICENQPLDQVTLWISCWILLSSPSCQRLS